MFQHFFFLQLRDRAALRTGYNIGRGWRFVSIIQTLPNSPTCKNACFFFSARVKLIKLVHVGAAPPFLLYIYPKAPGSGPLRALLSRVPLSFLFPPIELKSTKNICHIFFLCCPQILPTGKKFIHLTYFISPFDQTTVIPSARCRKCSAAHSIKTGPLVVSILPQTGLPRLRCST